MSVKIAGRDVTGWIDGPTVAELVTAVQAEQQYHDLHFGPDNGLRCLRIIRLFPHEVVRSLEATFDGEKVNGLEPEVVAQGGVMVAYHGKGIASLLALSAAIVRYNVGPAGERMLRSTLMGGSIGTSIAVEDMAHKLLAGANETLLAPRGLPQVPYRNVPDHGTCFIRHGADGPVFESVE